MFTRQDGGLMLVGTALSLSVSPWSAEIYLWFTTHLQRVGDVFKLVEQIVRGGRSKISVDIPYLSHF